MTKVDPVQSTLSARTVNDPLFTTESYRNRNDVNPDQVIICCRNGLRLYYLLRREILVPGIKKHMTDDLEFFIFYRIRVIRHTSVLEVFVDRYV
ncbi:9387_t:CDS:1, partial [Paraglomus occultum]